MGAGGLLTYTIAITNAGPATARQLTVTEDLPAGVAYVTHSVSAGAYDSTAKVWTLDALSVTRAATLTLVMRMIGDDTAINRVAVTSTVVDPVIGNNGYTLTTTVLPTGVSGKVYEIGTQAPLVGAQVVIADSGGHLYTATTGSGGWYTVTYRTAAPLTSGVITASGSYPGFAAATHLGTLVYGAISESELAAYLQPIYKSPRMTVSRL